MKLSLIRNDIAKVVTWIHLSRKERVLVAIASLAVVLVVGLAWDAYYFLSYVKNERVLVAGEHMSKAVLTNEDIDEAIQLLEMREEKLQKILKK